MNIQINMTIDEEQSLTGNTFADIVLYNGNLLCFCVLVHIWIAFGPVKTLEPVCLHNLHVQNNEIPLKNMIVCVS